MITKNSTCHHKNQSSPYTIKIDAIVNKLHIHKKEISIKEIQTRRKSRAKQANQYEPKAKPAQNQPHSHHLQIHRTRLSQ
jgi:hypothetical protein